jgi:hypothetical protein
MTAVASAVGVTHDLSIPAHFDVSLLLFHINRTV